MGCDLPLAEALFLVFANGRKETSAMGRLSHKLPINSKKVADKSV